MPAPRTPEQIRRDLEQERDELATAVERLRDELGEATDIAGKLRAKLPLAAAGAGHAGEGVAGDQQVGRDPLGRLVQQGVRQALGQGFHRRLADVVDGVAGVAPVEGGVGLHRPLAAGVGGHFDHRHAHRRQRDLLLLGRGRGCVVGAAGEEDLVVGQLVVDGQQPAFARSARLPSLPIKPPQNYKKKAQ